MELCKIKQIGKGAFSNVFLCKENTNSLLGMSGLLNFNDDEFFIVKEINIDNLVKKHIKKTSKNIEYKLKQNKFMYASNVSNNLLSNTQSVNITPYSTSYSNKLNNILKQIEKEEEYYYKKLKNLIDSEIEIMKMLCHKNIIKYISSDFMNEYTPNKNKIYHIKMEYCEYGDLYTILKEQNDEFINDFKLRNIYKGFDNGFINKFLQDILNAIKYLHDNNIIHRDIKLQNILIKKDNNITFKLSDFGFACLDVNENKSNKNLEYCSDALKKKYYKLCGTPYYMGPEMLLNIDEFEQFITKSESRDFDTKMTENKKKFYDKQIDIWSFGICLYELICNSLPFSSTVSNMNTLKKYYLKDDIQDNIYEIIDHKKINDNIKVLLKRLLIINPLLRISINELITLKPWENNKSNLEVKDYIELKHELKPVNKEMLNSWYKIDKSSSLINESMSIDNTFMKWLMN